MTDDRRNLVLSGFMGVGKSSVARAVAERLGRRLVEMDEIIAQRAGMSIAAIFTTQGEAAFRALERALCQELAAQEGLVIATGGGALVEEGNREALAAHGCLVCLDCAPAELACRLRGCADRPMLWGGDDAEARLNELFQARRAQYAEIPHHLDTTARTVAQVAEEVLALYAARPLAWRVSTPTGAYPVHLARGGISQLGALLRAREVGGNLAVVSDANVWPHWGEPLLAGLRGSDYAPVVIVLPAGEEQKHLDNVRLLYDRLAVAGVDRGAAVLALGGGVITDMAGFAAATFMRGVPLVPVPTTLLGMIDAAIGGKVAVDHPRGKNLIGAFVQPLLVMLDPDTLATLPDQERRAGLAEIIKAGVIADAALFAALEAGAPSADLRWEIERAIAVKIAVVEEDPYEQGRRAVLNLGHTFAHAFEVLSAYQLHHGLAVSMGLAAAARLAELRGVGTAALSERIISTLTRHGLPTTYEEHLPTEVYQAMRADKKRRGGTPRLVLPRAIGEVLIASDVTEAEIIAALERIRP